MREQDACSFGVKLLEGGQERLIGVRPWTSDSLALEPSSLEEKFGRLVGATELDKGPASQTKLHVQPGFRNDVLRTEQVIIGCGGGFHQECTQPHSPVAKWMAEVDIALNDEGQQYGNLDEASAIARVPPQRHGYLVWGP